MLTDSRVNEIDGVEFLFKTESAKYSYIYLNPVLIESLQSQYQGVKDEVHTITL